MRRSTERCFQVSRTQPRRLVCHDISSPVHLSDCSVEIPIIRNAGGRVTDDVLTSLEIMSTVMAIGNLIIIHHTEYTRRYGGTEKMAVPPQRCSHRRLCLRYQDWDTQRASIVGPQVGGSPGNAKVIFPVEDDAHVLRPLPNV
nr:hypothetical protein CFP56_71764 [Quercus suber]